jgi:hypothetical protein
VAKRNLINKYVSSAVPATNSDSIVIGEDPIPANRIFRVTCFGAALPAAGIVELQFRTRITPSERWRTLRAVIGPGHMHYHNFVPIDGDGEITALRIRRTNDDSNPQRIVIWIEGYKNERD